MTSLLEPKGLRPVREKNKEARWLLFRREGLPKWNEKR
jgi:hypothetical protein